MVTNDAGAAQVVMMPTEPESVLPPAPVTKTQRTSKTKKKTKNKKGNDGEKKMKKKDKAEKQVTKTEKKKTTTEKAKSKKTKKAKSKDELIRTENKEKKPTQCQDDRAAVGLNCDAGSSNPDTKEAYPEYTVQLDDIDLRREADRGYFHNSSTDDDDDDFVSTDDDDDFDNNLGRLELNSSWRADYARLKVEKQQQQHHQQQQQQQLQFSVSESEFAEDGVNSDIHDHSSSTSLGNSQHLFGGQSEIGRGSTSHRLMGSTLGLPRSHHRKGSTTRISTSQHAARTLSQTSLSKEDASILQLVLATSSSSSDGDSFAMDRPVSKHDKAWEYRLAVPSSTTDSTDSPLLPPPLQEEKKSESDGENKNENDDEKVGMDQAAGENPDEEAHLLVLQRKAERTRGDPSNYNSEEDEHDHPLANFEASENSAKRYELATGATTDEDDEQAIKQDSDHWEASVLAESNDDLQQSSDGRGGGGVFTSTFRRQKEQRMSRSSRTGLDPPARVLSSSARSVNSCSRQSDSERETNGSGNTNRLELREDLEAQVKARFEGKGERVAKELEKSIRHISSRRLSNLESVKEEHGNALALESGSADDDVAHKGKKKSKADKPTSATSVMDDDGHDDTVMNDREVKDGHIQRVRNIVCTRNCMYALVIIVALLLIGNVVLVVYLVKE